jgi:peroxiredoxin
MLLSSTSNSDRQRVCVTRFVLSGLVWFSPLLIWLFLLEFTMWRTGEIQPVVQVVQAMDGYEEKARFMRKYIDQALYRFKHISLELKKPRVVALGTSRVMQFRHHFFGIPSGEFFNAGGMIQHLRDLEEYARELPSNGTTQVIILGVEMWWFNDRWAEIQENQKNYLIERDRDDAFDGFAHARLLQLSIQGSLFGGDFADLSMINLLKLLRNHPTASKSQKFGLIAVSKGSGFRADGSFDYSVTEPSQSERWTFKDIENPPVAERIKLGTSGFEPVSGVSTTRIERFRFALRLLRAKGVSVICFVPPFASSVVSVLEQEPSSAAMWKGYLSDIPFVAREEGAACFVFRTPTDLGLDDRSMFDGLHGMETLHAVIVRHFYRDPWCRKVLAGNPATIERLLSDPLSTPWHVTIE